jgi:hypothetical protein
VPRQQILLTRCHFDVIWAIHQGLAGTLTKAGSSVSERQEFREVARFHGDIWPDAPMFLPPARLRRFIFPDRSPMPGISPAFGATFIVPHPALQFAESLTPSHNMSYHIDDEYSFSDVDLPNDLGGQPIRRAGLSCTGAPSGEESGTLIPRCCRME